MLTMSTIPQAWQNDVLVAKGQSISDSFFLSYSMYIYSEIPTKKKIINFCPSLKKWPIICIKEFFLFGHFLEASSGYGRILKIF